MKLYQNNYTVYNGASQDSTKLYCHQIVCKFQMGLRGYIPANDYGPLMEFVNKDRGVFK